MNPFALLPWLVFAQGLLLAVVVATRWRHRSNRFLAAFLLLLSVHGLVGFAWQNPSSLVAAVAGALLSCVPFLYGPLVYRYVWHSLFREWRGRVPFVVHAIPALLNLALYGGILLAVGGGEFAAVAAGVFSGRAPTYVLAVEGGKILSGVLYTAAIVRLVVRHREGLRRWAAREARRRWLVALVSAFAANWVLVVIAAVFLWGSAVPEGVTEIITAAQLLALLGFLYLVSFFALRYPAVLDPKEVRQEIRRKLNLPPGFVQETMRRLEKARIERFFTDPEVTLGSMAERLGLHPNALSYIINEETGRGFREYLNGLRLEEFLRLAGAAAGEAGGAAGGVSAMRGTTGAARAETDPDGSAPSRDTPTHLELALEAGFASKSTFLRAFKSRYGTTPATYLARLRDQALPSAEAPPR